LSKVGEYEIEYEDTYGAVTGLGLIPIVLLIILAVIALIIGLVA